ncbi:hypothetical protein TNCV_3599671 [Trichonephila clavipes]|nr:hypothetical protein TNCV_3599671 [Trichonephila clavipes]
MAQRDEISLGCSPTILWLLERQWLGTSNSRKAQRIYTRAIDDGPRNFEIWLSDEVPLAKLPHYNRVKILSLDISNPLLNRNSADYTT